MQEWEEEEVKHLDLETWKLDRRARYSAWIQMAKQSIPEVTAEDVERIVWRDFAPDEIEAVTTLLGEYDESRQEPIRVRLAALKLADGNLERLRARIQLATRDYRDVLAVAEYPGYMKAGLRAGKLPEDQKSRIVEDDWRQYEEWLRR